MKLIYQENPKRSFIKTIIWQIVAFSVTWMIGYMFFQEVQGATIFAIVANLIKMVLYYVHERIWSHIKYGIKTTTKNNKGFVLWLTGLPASGKSTVAEALLAKLNLEHFTTHLLDGDVVRKTINQDLGFSKEDRDKNIRRITQVSKLMSNGGANVIVAFISPYRTIRDEARKEIADFIEIFIKCPLEICESRDPKGMYKKARAGEILNFTGVSDPYEEPVKPELIINTHELTVDESIDKIVQYLKDSHHL